MGELKNILLDWCNKPRNIDKFLYNFDIQNNYSSSKCLYLHVCTTAIVNVTEIRGNIPSSLLLQSRYVQPPILVRINKSNFCQMWQKFPNPCIFASFCINELCQFWLFQRFPNSATHFSMNSGSFYMLMFAIFGKNVHYFYTSTYQLT